MTALQRKLFRPEPSKSRMASRIGWRSPARQFRFAGCTGDYRFYIASALTPLLLAECDASGVFG